VQIGIRFGHFYAYTLVSQIRPDDPNDGVVRVSFVHYNTEQEVEGVIKTLDKILFS
jgi:selenocysteine lyase/cysteine desulfurase